MKNKFPHILLLLFVQALALNAQTLQIPCGQVCTQPYRDSYYVCGVSENTVSGKASLRIYKVSAALAKTDSFVAELGKGKISDFLQLGSDTLHHFMNVYVQRKERGSLSIFRFEKDLKLKSEIAEVEVARLNSATSLGADPFYFKNFVYTIKAVPDSGGMEFFLNKSRLKAADKNFEYEYVWQFPFERRHINSARVIFANEAYAVLYTNVTDGNKRGQWLLKIDGRDGKLRKACRINDAMDFSFYGFSATAMDSVSKNLLIQGQKFTEAELDQAKNKFQPQQKGGITFYVAEIDSGLEMTSRQEYKIPVTEAKGAPTKTPAYYLLKTTKFYRGADGRTVLEYDLYQGSSGSLCFRFCNSGYFRLVPKEDKVITEKSPAGSNMMIERFYFSPAADDMNGKLCADSLSGFEKLYQRNPGLPVKLAWKMDETNNPVWILKKRDAKKSSEQYNLLSPVKKIYQLGKLAEYKTEQQAGAWILPPKQFVLMRQSAADWFTLEIFNW